MSADLLAELDSFYQPQKPDEKPDINALDQRSLNSLATFKINPNQELEVRDFAQFQLHSLVAQGEEEEQDEDDFGDFESARSGGIDSSHPVGVKINNAINHNSNGNNLSFDDSVKQQYRRTSDSVANEEHNRPGVNSQSTLPQSRYHFPAEDDNHVKNAQGNRDQDVLFDAEDEFEDDGFGDFETALMDHDQLKALELRKTLEKVPRLMSLVDLDARLGETSSQGTLIESANENLVFSECSSVAETAGQKTHGSHSGDLPHIVNSSGLLRSTMLMVEADEVWDELNVKRCSVEGSLKLDKKPSQRSTPGNITLRDNTPGTINPRPDQATPPLALAPILPSINGHDTSIPPSNIPPPVMLLSLFPHIFQLVEAQLLEPLSSHANSALTRDAILSHPATCTFLKSYLAVATVLARIIAGRKLRWKRDTLLAQSMRIGPASSSKSGGMKLTGIDKTENAKEEREIAEVLRLWRTQLGRLRSAMSGASSLGTIPEVTEAPVVRTAQESEGAIASPRPCALCALRRNERVLKGDFDVQDSFGEWWVEHWGHRSCFAFWGGQKERLKTR